MGVRCIASRWIAIAGVALSSAAAGAQAPKGAEHLADGAVRDSLAVLRTLHDAVADSYRNAPAWFHQGMIAWTLYERCRHQPPARGLDCTKPRLLADTAFIIATELDTANVTYALTLGRYLLASEGNFHRDSPYLDRLFHTSLEHVRLSGDTAAYANALIDASQLYWNRYDETAHRANEATSTTDVRTRAQEILTDSANRARRAGVPPAAIPVTREVLRKARNAMDAALLTPGDGYFGELDYVRTEFLLREALNVAPASMRGYRHLAQLLTARDRWPELSALARARVIIAPRDGWAWMTLGMSLMRRADHHGASLAFDSALVFLDSADVHRVDRIERVLNGRERASFESLNAAGKAAYTSLYWLTHDPLWSHEGDEVRLEFLTRVAYAELVWTSEDLSLHGVDSDRGRVYIRAGPPDRVYSGRRGEPIEMLAVCGNYLTRKPDLFGFIDWSYDYTRCLYRFDRFPAYATTTFSDDTTIRYANQTDWGNLVVGRIDSMPTQLVRFRAGADSVDVYLATQAPVAAIRAATDVKGNVRTDIWMKTVTAQPVVHDSMVPAASGATSFTYRVPAGSYLYRLESTADGSLVAGRSSAAFIAGDEPRTGFALRGFGISDLLLATRVDAPPVARRWSDLTMTPLLGLPARNSTLALVWEAYELANEHGNARYRVLIVLRQMRPTPSLGRRMVARIANGLAGAVGVSRKETADRVEFQYDRTVPHAAALTDHITISLGDMPPGSYALSLQVTDLVTNATTERTQPLVIAARSARPRQ